jgi:hypothetical protein
MNNFENNLFAHCTLFIYLFIYAIKDYTQGYQHKFNCIHHGACMIITFN